MASARCEPASVRAMPLLSRLAPCRYFCSSFYDATEASTPSRHRYALFLRERPPYARTPFFIAYAADARSAATAP